MQTTRRYLLTAQYLTWTFLIINILTILVGNQVNQRYARDHQHYFQEHLQTQVVLMDILNLETGSRGFVITGNETFLEPFNLGQKAFPKDATALISLIQAGHSEGRSRRLLMAEEIKEAQKGWLDYALNLLEVRRESFEQAQRLVAQEFLNLHLHTRIGGQASSSALLCPRQNLHHHCRTSVSATTRRTHQKQAFRTWSMIAAGVA